MSKNLVIIRLRFTSNTLTVTGNISSIPVPLLPPSMMLSRGDFNLPVMAAVFVRRHENISADIELLNSVCMTEVKRSYKRKNVLW